MRSLFIIALILTTNAFAQTYDRGLTELQWAFVDGDDARALEIIRKDPKQVHVISEPHYSSPLTHNVQWSTLQLAVIHERVKVIPEILKHRPNLNYQDTRHGYTALHVAVQRKNGGLELLLKAGANVHLQSSGLAELVGTDPLIMAINFDNLSAVRLLLKYGANPVRIQGQRPVNALNSISYLGRCFSYGTSGELNCYRTRMDMLKAVINYPGFNFNHVDQVQNRTPVNQIATQLPNAHGEQITAELLTLSRVMAEGIRLLINKGADPCIAGPTGTVMKMLDWKRRSNAAAAELFAEFSPRFDCY